jgi:hypothetical protein
MCFSRGNPVRRAKDLRDEVCPNAGPLAENKASTRNSNDNNRMIRRWNIEFISLPGQADAPRLIRLDTAYGVRNRVRLPAEYGSTGRKLQILKLFDQRDCWLKQPLASTGKTWASWQVVSFRADVFQEAAPNWGGARQLFGSNEASSCWERRHPGGTQAGGKPALPAKNGTPPLTHYTSPLLTACYTAPPGGRCPSRRRGSRPRRAGGAGLSRPCGCREACGAAGRGAG